MHRRRFAWRAVAVLTAVALVSTACSDNGEDEPTGGTDQPFEGTLSLGAILPETGSLSAYGEAMFAAADMAVEEINEAGGVWGSDVEITHRDEGESAQADVVQSAAEFMVSSGVHAIVGAAASTSSLNIMETFYNAQILMISPSNTGPDFTDHQYSEYYFRTAPSDVLQGSALADEVLADGYATMGILSMQNAYGEGLADHIEQVYTAGGGEVVSKEFFDPEQSEYAAEARSLRDADPDALVLVSYEQARQIIPALVGAGIGPDTKQWYFVDGNRLDYSEDFDEGLMEGVKATQPGAEEEPTEFYGRLDAFRSGLSERPYTTETYDAIIIMALAAIAANSDDPDSIKEQMVNVTQDGTNCTVFAECKQLLEEGEDIDYDGVSGPISWTEDGDPGEATIGIYEYSADNTYARIKSVPGVM